MGVREVPQKGEAGQVEDFVREFGREKQEA